LDLGRGANRSSAVLDSVSLELESPGTSRSGGGVSGDGKAGD